MPRIKTTRRDRKDNTLKPQTQHVETTNTTRCLFSDNLQIAFNFVSLPGIKTSTTRPTSINDAYPAGTEITSIDGIRSDFVYIIALDDLLPFDQTSNRPVYFKTPNGNPVALNETGTFTIGANTYKVLSTRGVMSNAVVQ